MYYFSVQCTVLCYKAVHCTILHFSILSYTTLQCTVLYYTSVHCPIQHFSILYYTTLQCAVNYFTVLQCAVLYYTTPAFQAVTAKHFSLSDSKSNKHKRPILWWWLGLYGWRIDVRWYIICVQLQKFNQVKHASQFPKIEGTLSGPAGPQAPQSTLALTWRRTHRQDRSAMRWPRPQARPQPSQGDNIWVKWGPKQ